MTIRGLAALFLLAAVALAGRPGLAQSDMEILQPELNDDGLYTQTWFLESFLDLNEDMQEAAGQGKRFAVIWEQRGCPYCKDTHTINFVQPEIQVFVRQNFEVLQLNLHGARKVTDFDGTEMEERALARRIGIAFTPTIQFFPADPAEAAGKTAKTAEVTRMPGYLKPPEFLAMFKYVEAKAYRDTRFRDYVKETVR